MPTKGDNIVYNLAMLLIQRLSKTYFTLTIFIFTIVYYIIFYVIYNMSVSITELKDLTK